MKKDFRKWFRYRDNVIHEGILDLVPGVSKVRQWLDDPRARVNMPSTTSGKMDDAAKDVFTILSHLGIDHNVATSNVALLRALQTVAASRKFGNVTIEVPHLQIIWQILGQDLQQKGFKGPLDFVNYFPKPENARWRITKDAVQFDREVRWQAQQQLQQQSQQQGTGAVNTPAVDQSVMQLMQDLSNINTTPQIRLELITTLINHINSLPKLTGPQSKNKGKILEEIKKALTTFLSNFKPSTGP